MKSNKLFKMMNDCGLVDYNKLTKKQLDLLFVQENKHKPNMEFPTFLNMLPKIAYYAFPDIPLGTLKRLIRRAIADEALQRVFPQFVRRHHEHRLRRWYQQVQGGNNHRCRGHFAVSSSGFTENLQCLLSLGASNFDALWLGFVEVLTCFILVFERFRNLPQFDYEKHSFFALSRINWYASFAFNAVGTVAFDCAVFIWGHWNCFHALKVRDWFLKLDFTLLSSELLWFHLKTIKIILKINKKFSHHN